MTRAVLDVVDPALPALATLFDPAELSRLLARPVVADRVRHKRGVSAVARLRSAEGTHADTTGARREASEPAPRWLAAYAGQHASKLDKTLKRAASLGYDVERVHRTDSGGDSPGDVVVSGPIGLDMKLHRVLQPFATDGRVVFEAGAVLNYNPHRRVVFRLQSSDGIVVCKAGHTGTATGSSETAFLGSLAAQGVPVLERASPKSAPARDELRYYPWFGEGDLQDLSSRGVDAAWSARAAGASLAELHAQPLDLGRGTEYDALHTLRRVMERNRQLLPASAGRLDAIEESLVRRLGTEAHTVLSHGDFSADQVLVGAGEVRLTDFDRSTTAPATLDVGAFVAADLLQERRHGRALREHFLQGYSAAAGDLRDGDLPAWVAAQLLDRLDEPFRACSADWWSGMHERLDLLEGVLDGGVEQSGVG